PGDVLQGTRFGTFDGGADLAAEVPLRESFRHFLPPRTAHVFVNLMADLVTHAGIVLAGSLEGKGFFHVTGSLAGPGASSMRIAAAYFIVVSHKPSMAPVGSDMMLSQPMPSTLVTSFRILAFSFFAFF